MVLTASLCNTPHKRDRLRKNVYSQIGEVGVPDSDEKGISLSLGIYQPDETLKWHLLT